MYDPSLVESEAQAMLVGGDYHRVENQGKSYLVVDVSERRAGESESLEDVYKPVASDKSGLTLLVTQDRLRMKPVVDAILEGGGVAVLPGPPDESTPERFREMFMKLWGELLAQKKEGTLMKEG
jgi:hypothetical protein